MLSTPTEQAASPGIDSCKVAIFRLAGDDLVQRVAGLQGAVPVVFDLGPVRLQSLLILSVKKAALPVVFEQLGGRQSVDLTAVRVVAVSIVKAVNRVLSHPFDAIVDRPEGLRGEWQVTHCLVLCCLGFCSQYNRGRFL